MAFDKQGLEKSANEVLVKLDNISSFDELKLIKSEVQSDNGFIKIASKSIGSLEPNERKEAGQILGQFSKPVLNKIAELFEKYENESADLELEKEFVDLSIPIKFSQNGARHPLNKLIEDFEDFFVNIGWNIESGPQIEAEWYNFDSLNFDKDHPARQMQDTFYIDKVQNVFDEPNTEIKENQTNLVLRTHTSPVETRSMLKDGVPIYIAAPGKVFRTDELDQTHTPVFHQVEGLAIDKNLSMANLKGTLDALAKHMFGSSTKTRLRPSYFPFTEPSAEMDIWYEDKRGGRWIEWLGCGMTHPNVLKSVGIDPEVYRGFAFGLGVERTLMFRHNISDMHDVVEGDIRFSNQFGLGGLK